MTKSLLLPFLVALLSGCLAGTDAPAREAGGSAVEGETVTARLVDSRGNPFREITIRLRDEATGLPLGTASTDSTGSCVLRIPGGVERLILEFDDPSRPDGVVRFLLVLHPGLDTTLVVEPWSSLRGRVVPPAGWRSVEVIQRELGITASAASDTFRIPFLPPGTWDLVLVADSGGTRRTFDLPVVRTGPGVPQEVALLPTGPRPRITLDFEEPLADLAIACVHQPVSATTRDCADTAIGTSAWSGTSLRATLEGTLGARNSIRFLLGAPGSDGLAVHRLDTLRLRLRGTGKLLATLATNSADSLETAGETSVVASPEWRRIDLPLAGLLPPTKDGATIAWVDLGTESKAWLVIDHLEVVPGSE